MDSWRWISVITVPWRLRDRIVSARRRCSSIIWRWTAGCNEATMKNSQSRLSGSIQPPAASRILSRASRGLRGLDFDTPPARLLGLGNPHGEHAVFERGVDALGVRLLGQDHAILKAPHAAGAPAQDAGAFALDDLTRDDEFGVAHLDVDVLAADARHLGLDDPRVVGLLDVDGGDPRQVVSSSGARRPPRGRR